MVEVEVSFEMELAGTIFGGDADYWKTELRTAKFIPTFSPWNRQSR